MHSGKSTVIPCSDVTPLWALCVAPGAGQHCNDLGSPTWGWVGVGKVNPDLYGAMVLLHALLTHCRKTV